MTASSENETLRRELAKCRAALEAQKGALAELDKIAKGLVQRDFKLSLANEELRELDRLKSEFVSVAAHQLRTPLSAIKWAIDMLVSGELGKLGNEQKTFLMKAYESTERMILLINDMLSADRIESGRFLFMFTPTNLLDLLDKVLYEVLPQANKKKLAIRFEKRPTTLPPVSADPERMRVVFQNLLENAIAYTMEGGLIRLAVEAREKEIEFTVADNGIGIPKEQQPYIFNRLFRAKNAVKAETNGSGLGLFIAKTIVEKHGGRIWFESEGTGHGSSFYFTIPFSNTAKH
ncbi:MAG: multi-sensor signal transduction histidine kinase [Parcubacteria group bacterium Gr01-1014_17]|nr:MAG: multi-sensor signal transduction histidine kinase [Parcubacteria group bacterium Gr01-1014_17]